MVIFALVLFTLLSFAALVINVGQVLARKQLAQKIADIGALAGASEQASGLNRIADINSRAFYFLRWTALVTRAYPFDFFRGAEGMVDNFLSIEQLGIFDPLNGDVEDELNDAPIRAENLARLVTEDNIKRLFPSEDISDFAYYNPDPSPQTFNDAVALFAPSGRHQRDVHWWYYTTRGCAWWDLPCWEKFAEECIRAYAYLAGGLEHHTFTTYRTRANPSDEIHFYWRVTIPETPAIMGILPALPPVTAISKAKPYGGHSGDRPEPEEIPNYYFIPFFVEDCTCPTLLFPPLPNNWWSADHTYMVEHDFSRTFKAKLDAMTEAQDADLLALIQAEFPGTGQVLH